MSMVGRGVDKAPTGIVGFDEITEGGLPRGRSTLVCGGPGCGKTVFAMESVVRGASEFGEPGLFVSFEEKADRLAENFRSLGFDIEGLVRDGMLKILPVDLSPGEIVQSGEFSLDGLRIRLEHAIGELGARRVALDTLEKMFAALAGSDRLRNEVGCLLDWLHDQDVTTVVTGERGAEELTRHGFEEYVSDCVILLDHRVSEQVSKRRLRVIKYRGSGHGVDEHPFLITDRGLSVLPITSVDLEHPAQTERISTGVSGLDDMVGGEGYFRGTTVLISGKAGTGKSSLAAAFAVAACEGGERCLYVALEESPSQLARNMASIGVNVDPWMEKGLLKVHAFRPTLRGLEEHLVSIMAQVETVEPDCVVIDPVTNFITVGRHDEVRSMLTRMLHYLKGSGITLVFTALTPGSGRPDETEAEISSMMDTWIALDIEAAGRTRYRTLHVVKSRGMEHSHQIHELVMSGDGLFLQDGPAIPESGGSEGAEPRLRR